MNKYIQFPKYANYPSVLHVGFKSNDVKNVIGKKILIILDVTGSMGEYCNQKKEGTKITFAKQIIKQIIDTYPFSIVDILPFAQSTQNIVSYENIPEPKGCTNFSPIFNEIKSIINQDCEYISTIFISDGLPSEPLDIASDAIMKTGSYCREMNTNTITIAIGSDADGKSCSLFTGNRGYNCFVKFESEIDFVVNDVINGIKCNFILIGSNWIPIESNGLYYYINDTISTNQTKPDIESVRKYISLIIQEEISNLKYFDSNKLIEFINQIANCLDNLEERNEIIDFFTKSIVVVKKAIKKYASTPSGLSAAKQAYQTYSLNTTGI